jgi:hypothetical protein
MISVMPNNIYVLSDSIANYFQAWPKYYQNLKDVLRRIKNSNLVTFNNISTLSF